MQSDSLQPEADLVSHQEILEIREPLFYQKDKTPVGWFTHLALEAGDWQFSATPATGGLHRLAHPSGVSFLCELSEGKGECKGTYSIKGCVKNAGINDVTFFDGANLHGNGKEGWKLRPAQLGAVHSLLAHWTLSKETATIVLPTGTGKTETMLATTLIDRALRTLVVVPTKDLKDQIAAKFKNWGMLKRLGVIPENAPNPKVLVLDRTVGDLSFLNYINAADVELYRPRLSWLVRLNK